MTAVWQSFANRSEGLGTDPVVTKPSGTVDGDLLIAIGYCTVGQTLTLSGKTPHSASLGNSNPLWVWTASSEPANYTFVASGASTNSVVQMVRISGQNTTSTVNKASGATAGGGTAAIVIPTVTPDAGESYFLMQMVVRITSTLFTPPGTATERYDATAAASSFGTAGGDEIVAGGSATGTRTWTSASSSGGAVGYMLAIRSAPPKTGTFTGSYDFTGSGFAGAAGPSQGAFTGGYDFTGAFTGAAGPSEGTFTGAYAWDGSGFVGVAGAPSAYGFFNGGYDFTGSFTGQAPPEPSGDGLWTPGGRDRFTVRRTPKNRRRSR